jgi:hypothetical protein
MVQLRIKTGNALIKHTAKDTTSLGLKDPNPDFRLRQESFAAKIVHSLELNHQVRKDLADLQRALDDLSQLNEPKRSFTQRRKPKP